MTKEQEKNIKRLIKLRKKAGERVMEYDAELSEEFEKIGGDLSLVEGGTNSVFLITEPDYCSDVALKMLGEIKKGGAE